MNIVSELRTDLTCGNDMECLSSDLKKMAADEIERLTAEVERLRLWVRRIDNINDDPARFSAQIDQACTDALAGKPMTGAVNAVQQSTAPAKEYDVEEAIRDWARK